MTVSEDRHPCRGHPPDDIPEEEHLFYGHLERHTLEHGISPEDPLLGSILEADGPATYRAGRRIVRELADRVEWQGARVLDLGCGFGGALVSLGAAGACCTGVDLDGDRLRTCRVRLDLHGVRARLLQADLRRLPFRDDAFDVAICTEVLEHLGERQRVVAELARVLRPRGTVYIAFPNLLSLRNAWRDPHCLLPGATLLPVRLANWYALRARGRHYGAEVLPVSLWIARLCARSGLLVHELCSSEEVLLERVSRPETIRGPRSRAALRAAKLLGLAPALRGLIRLRATLGPGAVLVGTKSSAQATAVEGDVR